MLVYNLCVPPQVRQSPPHPRSTLNDLEQRNDHRPVISSIFAVSEPFVFEMLSLWYAIDCSWFTFYDSKCFQTQIIRNREVQVTFVGAERLAKTTLHLSTKVCSTFTACKLIDNLVVYSSPDLDTSLLAIAGLGLGLDGFGFRLELLKCTQHSLWSYSYNVMWALLSANSTGTSFPVTSPQQMLRGSRQLVKRKSGVSPACDEEVTRKLATSPTSPRGSYGETGPSGIWAIDSYT